VLVPGRTKNQCRDRWHGTLNPNITMTGGRTGSWTQDEDIKLKDAVQRHGAKDWGATAVLVPGRTKKQCWSRWHDVLNPSIALAAGRAGKWTEDEDSKLKDAVQTYGCKNWGTISALVPSRTKKQCCDRWHDALDPNIDWANGRNGRWTEVEVAKLNDAVLTHGDNNWKEIAALVPGRTKKQCCTRWHTSMDPNRGTVRRKEQGTLKYAPGLG
jgi:myb proto-oncogene protein